MVGILAILAAQAAALAAAPAYDHEAVAKAFAQSGFACRPYSAATGLVCTGKLAPNVYPEPVAVIVPPSFEARAQADLLLYLHGWVDPGVKLESTLAVFRLAESFAQTGRNSLLVVPHSEGHCDTFKAYLAPLKTFQAFLDAVTKLVQTAGLATSPVPATLTLSGHSGADTPLGAILTASCDETRQLCYRSLVHEVVLFETVYGNAAEGFLAYARTAPRNRFVSVFLPLKKDDGSWKWTAAGNFRLWSELNPGLSPNNFIGATLSPGRPSEDIDEAASRGPVFMQSDVDHNETVRKYFTRLLRVSR